MAVGPLTAEVRRGASFSRDRRYRYHLARAWSDDAPPLVWVMLNPSAADDMGDDPTTRRVMGLSRSWGFGGCHVVNLFALRSQRPRALADADDPVGPGNARAMAAALRTAGPSGLVVVGWGRQDATSIPVAAASQRVLRRIRRAGLRPVTVGHNADGSPRHPLYVPSSTRPVGYSAD